MSHWCENKDEVDYFGFDPASPSVQLQNGESETATGHPTPQTRDISHEISTKLSLGRPEFSKTKWNFGTERKSCSNAFQRRDEDHFRETPDFWGFDPAVHTHQPSLASRQDSQYECRRGNYAEEATDQLVQDHEFSTGASYTNDHDHKIRSLRRSKLNTVVDQATKKTGRPKKKLGN